jgi:predicted DNA-binding transcriptional regulator YafY
MQILTRLERLDRLESWLKSDDAVVLRDAAEELGVSLRTIHRDLELLRERGVPVESERGRGGGVRISSGWGVGRIALTRREALDLLVGLAIGDVIHGGLQMGHSQAINRKIMGTFPPTDQRRIGAIRKRIRIGAQASSTVFDTFAETPRQVGEQLREAFALSRLLTVRYADRAGTQTERHIEPHFLILNSPVWYVVGWDHMRHDKRTFRCDRIINAKIRAESFAPRPWADFAATMEGNPTREV